MKKLMFLLGIIFISFFSIKSSDARLESFCIGAWKTITIYSCYQVYITDSYLDERCDKHSFTFCNGIGYVELPFVDNDVSIYISQDIIINNVEFDDGTVMDIIIPAGEEVFKFDEEGIYYVNYYELNN